MKRTTDFDYDGEEINRFAIPKLSRSESDEFAYEPSLFRSMPTLGLSGTTTSTTTTTTFDMEYEFNEDIYRSIPTLPPSSSTATTSSGVDSQSKLDIPSGYEIPQLHEHDHVNEHSCYYIHGSRLENDTISSAVVLNSIVKALLFLEAIVEQKNTHVFSISSCENGEKLSATCSVYKTNISISTPTKTTKSPFLLEFLHEYGCRWIHSEFRSKFLSKLNETLVLVTYNGNELRKPAASTSSRIIPRMESFASSSDDTTTTTDDDDDDDEHMPSRSIDSELLDFALEQCRSRFIESKREGIKTISNISHGYCSTYHTLLDLPLSQMNELTNRKLINHLVCSVLTSDDQDIKLRVLFTLRSLACFDNVCTAMNECGVAGMIIGVLRNQDNSQDILLQREVMQLILRLMNNAQCCLNLKQFGLGDVLQGIISGYEMCDDVVEERIKTALLRL
jgi:hypothetical protein